MKELWKYIYLYVVVILIASCFIAVVHHINELRTDLDNVREELIATQYECRKSKQEIARWERLNETTLRLLAEGGWE